VLRAKVKIAAKGDVNATTCVRCCYHLLEEVLQKTNGNNATIVWRRCCKGQMVMLPTAHGDATNNQ
jgi:hypothetical protein